LGDEFQSFEMAWVSGYLSVVTEQDYPVAEVRCVWNIDAAAVVEEAVTYRYIIAPAHDSNRSRSTVTGLELVF